MSSIIILMHNRLRIQHFSTLKIPNLCLLFFCFSRILRNKIGSLGGPGAGHSSLHSASHFPVKQSTASASSSLGLTNRCVCFCVSWSQVILSTARPRRWPTPACTSTSRLTPGPPRPGRTPRPPPPTITTPPAAPPPSRSRGRPRGGPVVRAATPPGDTSGQQPPIMHQEAGASLTRGGAGAA